MYRFIEQRRKDTPNSNDLMSVLLAPGRRRSGMTNKQLRDEVLTLFLAGHETTAFRPHVGDLLLDATPRSGSQDGRRGRRSPERSGADGRRRPSSEIHRKRVRRSDAPLSAVVADRPGDGEAVRNPRAQDPQGLELVSFARRCDPPGWPVVPRTGHFPTGALA